MAATLAALILSLDLLLVALLFWTLIFRRWKGAAGAALALVGSLPALRLALAGEFRLGAMLALLATLAAGGALIAASLSREWRDNYPRK